jgi:hypothetical protein
MSGLLPFDDLLPALMVNNWPRAVARGVLELDPRHPQPPAVGRYAVGVALLTIGPKSDVAIKQSSGLFDDFAALCAPRERADADISPWAAKVDDARLAEELTWSE